MLSLDEPRSCVEQSRSNGRKRRRSGAGPMGKELSSEQKAIVKMYVTRGANEGVVTCCYCDKEISSRNVDRWASHLRGCLKTPDDIKAQIRPSRGVSEATETTGNGSSASVPVALEPTKLETQTPSAAVLPAPPAEVAIAAPTSVSMIAPSPQLSSALQSLGSSFSEVFKVHVSKDYMKFNAAHFIAYKGFREKLHGHNYRLAVTITGQVGKDGYVVDFGEIKKISRVICNELNESFLVPMNSDALKISFDGTNVHIVTEDMAQFSFPKSDCSLLPIVHSSAEELAIYISNQLVDAFTLVALLERGVSKIEVSISEANQQFASYERTILA